MIWPWSHNKHRKEEKEIIFVEQTDIIIIEDQHYKRWNPEKEELNIIEQLVKVVDRLTKQQHSNKRLVLTTNFNNSKVILMSINLAANQFSVDTLGLQDSDTGAIVSATFANSSFTSSDENVFTTTPDPSNPNQTTDKAVGAGSAQLSISTDATYVDSNTQQSVTKTVSLVVDVTVTAVVTAENVTLTLTQGAPQPQ